MKVTPVRSPKRSLTTTPGAGEPVAKIGSLVLTTGDLETRLNPQMVRAETLDFWGVVFNPSTINRLTHTLIGAWVLGSFFIMSISAWYLPVIDLSDEAELGDWIIRVMQVIEDIPQFRRTDAQLRSGLEHGIQVLI